MEYLNATSYTLLDLTRSSCEKCNYEPTVFGIPGAVYTPYIVGCLVKDISLCLLKVLWHLKYPNLTNDKLILIEHTN